MVDVTYTALVPATETDLITLAEAKVMLGMDPTDTSKDAQITMLISVYSEWVSEMCGRTFAKETGVETWRELYDGRLFLTHWPVAAADVTSVMSAGVDYTGLYELEERSGKLSNVVQYAPESSPWEQSVDVTYTGGFTLPDEAPMPLKRAAALMIQDDLIRTKQAQTAGIRQISHKEKRVTFFDPNAVLLKTLGAKTPGQQAAEALLVQYIRFWV